MLKSVSLMALVALVLTGCASASVSEFAADGSCDGARVTVNFAGLGRDVSSCVQSVGMWPPPSRSCPRQEYPPRALRLMETWFFAV